MSIFSTARLIAVVGFWEVLCDPALTEFQLHRFAWTVSSKNTRGADFIGWKLVEVQYYRAQQRVPCGTGFPQRIVIDAGFSPNDPLNYGPYTNQYGNTFYGVPYEANTLCSDVTATTVTSVRNGQVSTNTTSK